MDKFPIPVCPEELAEVEGLLVISVFAHEVPEAVGVNADGREPRVRVVLAYMLGVPLPLRLLLHDVVPGEDLALVVVIQEVEWSSGKLQDLGLRLCERVYDAASELGLCSLMRLIDDDEIPLCGEHLIVLVEPAAYLLTPSEILHGGKVDIAVSIRNKFLEPRERLSLRARTVMVILAVIENLAIVLKPAIIDNRPVGEYQRSPELRLPHDLQCAERLTEAHLRVPEHLVALSELLQGPVYRLPLLWAEHYR